jgi:monovalent cation:H+ antiporter-2, CPA2 family
MMWLDLNMLVLASGGGASSFAKDLLVVLVAAGFVSVFLKRLRLTSIPGYLLIGAVIGAIGVLSQPEAGQADNVGQISDLAIVLLMFTIGMHLDLDSISEGMVHVVMVGVGTTLASMAIGWPIAMMFGLSAPAGLAVVMGLSMSSTAVVLGILQSRRELHAIHGRLCVGVSLIQDLLSIAVLALMPLLAAWGTTSTGATTETAAGANWLDQFPRWGQLLIQGLLALGGIGVMLAFGRHVLPRLLREAGRGGNTEAMLVVSAAAAFSAAVLTQVLGFGAPLGAFLSGLLLSATPFKHQLAGQLSPMRDLFMAIFFTAVGAKIDLGTVASNWWIIVLGVIALFAVKGAVIGIGAWAGGATGPIAGLTAVYLAQGGEFSLVVLNEAEKKGIVTSQTQSLVIAVVVVSLILATPVVEWGRGRVGKLSRIRPAGWIRHSFLRGESSGGHGGHGGHEQPPTGTTSASAAASETGAVPGDGAVVRTPKSLHVIIAGFGVVGRNLAEHFAAQGITYSIVELNTSTVEKQERLGRRAVFGDISNIDVLESIGIHEADAVVLTIPDDDATLRACKAIRQVRPDVFIAARTSYLSKAITATELGADHVTVEEVVTAQDMAVKVVHQLARRAAKAGTPHL